MNFKNLILPAVALGGAALLLVPEQAIGFSTIGGSLSLTQRDNRVFDNFQDPQANNNTIADPNWPGYTGAELSIWKACSEWGSELHNNNGLGDPLQSVGSGGANFDITWQGNANGVGGTNDNIHSGVNSCQSGVLAYTEIPISNGWRIRYCEAWTWQDGPGNNGSIDLQGVAAHEFGHALGLGHSNVGGATMFPSISGSGTSARSIAADDIAGVKFIYGAKSASKPHVSTVTESAGTVAITGTNFSATNNEVWFTQAGTGGSGQPIKVTGVTSNGSSIVVNLPANAGPGDVLVRNSGTAFSNLSNQVALEPGVCPSPMIYCTAKVTSSGGTPTIGFSGTPSFAINNFALTNINGFVPNTNGIHFWSNTGQASTPFSNGILCIAPPTVRGPAHVYDNFGFISVPVPIQLVDIGTTRWFQFWFRDVNQPDGTGIGLSDAVEVAFCP